VLVGDDPSENDGDPLRDGQTPGNPGAGVIVVRAEAFGPFNVHKVVELTMADPAGRAPNAPAAGHTGARIVSWREAP
jgi:hypothetical protein